MSCQPNQPVPLRITPARHADLPAICAIEAISFPTPWSTEALSEEINRSWSIFRVLRDPTDAVLAYINYWVVYDEIHVLNIATHPDHRRRGYARILLTEMVKLARRNAARLIHLEVRPSNLAAQSLYSSLGFEQASVRKGYYPDTGEDALIYILTLEAT